MDRLRNFLAQSGKKRELIEMQKGHFGFIYQSIGILLKLQMKKSLKNCHSKHISMIKAFANLENLIEVGN